MAETATNQHSVSSELYLSQTCRHLLKSALSTSSRQAYLRSWKLLNTFCEEQKLEFTFPCTISVVCNFIGYLYSKQLAASSIASHISAISFIHKLANCSDPTQSFIVKKILKGTQNLAKTSDSRLPITVQILQNIIKALDHTVPIFYNRIMLKSIFLLAFHSFLRLGELVIRSTEYESKVLQKQDVSLVDNKTLQITLRHFKNMKNNQPITITLSSDPTSSYCPVTTLAIYLQNANHKAGPLFTFPSGIPVSQNYVTNQLKLAVTFCNLDPKLYKGHSFRIGAATEAAKRGMSENEIQELGRWNSNALRRYIRIKAFSV